MSAKLTKALEFANYRVTLNNQRDAIRAKAESLLNYSINGGTFTIDRTLIAFCKTLIDEQLEECILLDDYNNPIRIDLLVFYEEILSRYSETTNDYYIEYEKIKAARSVSKVIDIKDDR